jgi:adenosine kinase
MKRILVCWSIANDFIMSYPSKFSDLVVAEHLDNFNLAFTVPNLEKQEWWTAQNISYSLGLLGLRDQTLMVWSVWKDFIPSSRLEEYINYKNIFRDNALFTAVCYVITAMWWQQIIAFHPGAMSSAAKINIDSHLSQNILSEIAYAIIAPNNKEAMLNGLQECSDKKIPVFFDPGQALELFSQEELRHAIQQATYLICNEHEFALLQRRSWYTVEDLVVQFEKIVVTLGKNWVQLLDKEHNLVLPSIVIENPLDTTGCGDWFRSGLLYGLFHGKSWEDAAKIGNAVGYYVAQFQWGMNHRFTMDEILAKSWI